MCASTPSVSALRAASMSRSPRRAQARHCASLPAELHSSANSLPYCNQASQCAVSMLCQQAQQQDALPAQGPVASISAREATLGRSSGATKAVRSAAKAIGRLQARVPLTVRGVRIELRSAATLATTSSSSRSEPSDEFSKTSSRQFEPFAHNAKQQPGLHHQGGRPGSEQRRPQRGLLRRLQRWLLAAARAAWRAARSALLWLVPALHSLPSRLLSGIAVQCVCALLSAVPVRLKDVQLTHQVSLRL